MAKDINRMNDEELEQVENGLVGALMEAASYLDGADKRRLITIKRYDRVLFKFTIEPITEDVWQKCRRQNLMNRGKATEELNNSRFLAQAIYEATVDEDKQRLWQNRDVWQKLNVASGVDVVNLVLTPAEKTAIANKLSEISGFDDDGLDDLIKNC